MREERERKENPGEEDSRRRRVKRRRRRRRWRRREVQGSREGREKENFKCNYSNNKSVIVSCLVKRLRGRRRLRGSSGRSGRSDRREWERDGRTMNLILTRTALTSAGARSRPPDDVDAAATWRASSSWSGLDAEEGWTAVCLLARLSAPYGRMNAAPVARTAESQAQRIIRSR